MARRLWRLVRPLLHLWVDQLRRCLPAVLRQWPPQALRPFSRELDHVHPGLLHDLLRRHHGPSV